MEGLPPPPDETTELPDPVLVDIAEPLLRIYFRGGAHPAAWDAMRSWGPVSTCRFDPHPPPPGDHPSERVAYAARDLPTALAEVFQGTWVIDRRRDLPHLAGWTPTRPLRVLDLSGDWALRARATGQINAGARETCRSWARAIRARWPDLDGLRHRSTLTQDATCVTLWAPAQDAFPAAPTLDRALDDPAVLPWLLGAVDRIGYEVA